MSMREAEAVLVGVEDMIDDLVYTDIILHLGKNVWTGAAHPLGVAFHHSEISADCSGEVGFIDDEEI